MAAPRGLTQPLTSFIGLLCQGIHRVPLQHNTHTTNHTPTHKHARGRRSITEKQDARVHYPVLTQHPHQPHTPHEDAQPAQPSGTTTPHTGRVCHPRHPTMHQHTKRHTIYPLPSKKATHRQPSRARHTRTPLEHPPSTQKTHPHHQHSSANAQKNIYSLERR